MVIRVIKKRREYVTKIFRCLYLAPLQAYLKINTNEPSNNNIMKTAHNQIMYQWAAEQNLTLLITGSYPSAGVWVFDASERLYRNKQIAIRENDTMPFIKLILK